MHLAGCTENPHNLWMMSGVQTVRLPPRSPDLSSYIECFRRFSEGGCLERMIFFGAISLRNALQEFLDHFHSERNHLGWGTG
jgi:hypothetical protein